MKQKHIVSMGFLLLFLLCLFPLATKAEKVEKEIIVGVAPNPFVTLTSVGGKGTADFRELFQKGADEFKKRYGQTITLKLFPSPKFLFKALQDRSVDFSLMALPVYLTAKKQGLPVKAFLNIITRDAKPLKFCIYIHKDSGIKNVSQLKGKNFVIAIPVFLSRKDALPQAESYIYWVFTKKLLEKEGIKAPFKDFFKEFRVLPIPGESIAYSVLLKRFDATLSVTTFIQSLKNYDKGFSDLVPIACQIGSSDSPMVYHKDIDPEIFNRMKHFFYMPKKSKMLNEISKEFKGITFSATEDKNYEIYFKWLKEAEQKGWLKEFDEIMTQVMKEKKFKDERFKPKGY